VEYRKGDPDARLLITVSVQGEDVKRKVKPIAEGRRLRAYLATGRYRDELADARWVA